MDVDERQINELILPVTYSLDCKEGVVKKNKVCPSGRCLWRSKEHFPKVSCSSSGQVQKHSPQGSQDRGSQILGPFPLKAHWLVKNQSEIERDAKLLFLAFFDEDHEYGVCPNWFPTGWLKKSHKLIRILSSLPEVVLVEKYGFTTPSRQDSIGLSLSNRESRTEESDRW